MWLARKGITVVKKLFNEQEMGVVGYYCGLISKKLFNEQEMCVVGARKGITVARSLLNEQEMAEKVV